MQFFSRLYAMIKKEYKQIVRDKSSFVIGIAIPMMLILIIGYGMSLDVKNVPVAVVMEDSSPVVRDMFSFMNGSEYFEPHYVNSMQQGIQMMNDREVDAIVCAPVDFTSTLTKGNSHVQIILWGVDAATARISKSYIEMGLLSWQQANIYKYPFLFDRKGIVSVDARQWFNEANTSTWFFIPGLIVLIMTLVGVFLTTMVMAREWERGTLESLFITPIKPIEILLSKWIPYFSVSLIGFALCMLSARYLFEVPIRGSLSMIIVSSFLYLMTTLGLGLTVSSVIKEQFLSCQISLLLSLLPTIMLSGLIFDLKSTPLIVDIIGHLLPATYYMELLKTLFLVGNNWSMIIKNCGILIVSGAIFFGLSYIVTKKRLE